MGVPDWHQGLRALDEEGRAENHRWFEPAQVPRRVLRDPRRLEELPGRVRGEVEDPGGGRLLRLEDDHPRRRGQAGGRLQGALGVRSRDHQGVGGKDDHQVECWNKLDGNVGELSSWVTTKDSAAPEGKSEISIEKLESQLNTLKTMFAEKQKLVADLEVYGAGHGGGAAPAPAAPAEAPAEAPAVAPAAEAAPPAEETPAA